MAYLIHPHQEISANFDRGCYFLKHVSFKFIGKHGVLSQYLGTNTYNCSCNIPLCPCNNFNDYENIEITTRKLSPVLEKTSSTCSIHTDSTSLPTPSVSLQTTPREPETQLESSTNNENETHEEAYDEMLKCYVNVFTHCITVGMYISNKTIPNIKIYIKDNYVSTFVSSPIIYSGKFDWDNKLATLESGSINGSSTVFHHLQRAVKSAQRECQIIEEMLLLLSSNITTTNNHYNDTFCCKPFRKVCRSDETNASSTIYNDANNSNRNRAHEESPRIYTHKRVYNLLKQSHFKIVKTLLFQPDFQKLNMLISDYLLNIEPITSSLSTICSSLMWPLHQQQKYIENSNYIQYTQDVDKFNSILSKHSINGCGISYQLLSPQFLGAKLNIEITIPSVEALTIRINELKSFIQSIMIKG